MRAAVLAALLAGCGAGSGESGPPANPPFSGAAGYVKVPGDYVIVDSQIDLGDPAVLTDSADGPFALWITRNGSEIWRTDMARIGTNPTPLRPAVLPTEPWEQGRCAKAAVERDATGFHMAYEAAGSTVALADSSDGEHWTQKRMLGPGHAPSLRRGFVFYEQLGQIWRAPASGEAAFPIVVGTNPDMRVRTTPAERELWQLFFNCPGQGGASVAICYAGSFDGEHFATGDVPLLQPDAPSELGPTGFVGDDAAILFFGQTPAGFRSRIAAAIATAP
jgi:hypothetical protein